VEANLGQPLDRLNSVASSQSVNSSDGLAEALDGFFNAFQALSADPTSTVLRQQVILSAQGVARKLNSVDKNLVNTQNQIVSQISQEVTDINTSLSDIAKLNGQISMIEVGGKARANDLRDGRQQMVEELSKHIDLNTQEQADGSLTVRLGSAAGALLVSGAYSGNTASAATVKLAVDGAAPTLDLKSWTGGEAEIAANLDAVAPQPASGTLAARIEAVNTVIGGNAAGLIQD
jgi:flagellar hook-associated protein 1 FlgK